ncbi:MAG TPA: histidine kinase dimerization/phospho-acceptor domain-containing protein, partial [Thermoanaerobaculia bacterium]|nr:histidine kinase dimerization/phospho-acceptor domain-containing protein [Thermoanaerobaculia bacterium]
MRLLGLPPKLRLAPLWPALAAVVVASAFLWSILPTLFERSSADQLLDTLRLFAPVVAGRTASPPAELQRWVRQVGAESGLRVTLVQEDGRVVADSARTAAELAAMENHAGRPEVRQALAQGQGTSVRQSATTGQVYAYAAHRLTDPQGRVLVLRLAQPLEQLGVLRSRLAAALALSVLAAGIAILLTSLWLDRRLFQPLLGLIAGAGNLAAGRSQRVEVPDEEELAALALSLNRLAETAEAQFAAVRAERDHLKAILASMAEGVLVVGADGRARLVNQAFRQIFDLHGEVTGRPVLEIVRQPGLARLVEDTLRLGEGQTGSIEIQAPERRTLLLASAALSGEGGAVVVARDTTELTRVADMRRDFVANVSHELKTPLAAIRGYAETLRDGALEEPPTARRFTDRILIQCRRLQALLDDLLTLSRLEAVADPQEREPVDLPAVARRALALVTAAAREKRVRLEIEEKAVPRIPGEADALERMLVNLVDNAIKYNRPEGRVTVRLAPEGGQVLVEVADTGIGIPPESLSRIFER